MSVTATPALQINVVDPSTNPTDPIALQACGVALYCAGGAKSELPTLPAATANLPLPFPIGITTAVYIFIGAITCTDLIVKVGSGSPVALSVPLGQGVFFYGLTSSQITISSALGGQIQYSIGG